MCECREGRWHSERVKTQKRWTAEGFSFRENRPYWGVVDPTPAPSPFGFAKDKGFQSPQSTRYANSPLKRGMLLKINSTLLICKSQSKDFVLLHTHGVLLKDLLYQVNPRLN